MSWEMWRDEEIMDKCVICVVKVEIMSEYVTIVNNIKDWFFILNQLFYLIIRKLIQNINFSFSIGKWIFERLTHGRGFLAMTSLILYVIDDKCVIDFWKQCLSMIVWTFFLLPLIESWAELKLHLLNAK